MDSFKQWMRRHQTQIFELVSVGLKSRSEFVCSEGYFLTDHHMGNKAWEDEGKTRKANVSVSEKTRRGGGGVWGWRKGSRRTSENNESCSIDLVRWPSSFSILKRKSALTSSRSGEAEQNHWQETQGPGETEETKTDI